jgi:hypothetical protein
MPPAPVRDTFLHNESVSPGIFKTNLMDLTLEEKRFVPLAAVVKGIFKTKPSEKY